MATARKGFSADLTVTGSKVPDKNAARRKRPLPLLSVVDEGILKGYVPLDKDWSGFSSEDYQMASQSVYDEIEPDGNLNIPGQENEKRCWLYSDIRGSADSIFPLAMIPQ